MPGDEGGSTIWPGGDRGFHTGTQDEATGLIHLGARMYDPVMGRFLSVDPIIDLTDSQQVHGYAYANNNPLAFSDPSGLQAIGYGSGKGWTGPDENGVNRNTGTGAVEYTDYRCYGIHCEPKDPAPEPPDPPVDDNDDEGKPWWQDLGNCVANAGDCAKDVGNSIDDAWDTTYDNVLKPIGTWIYDNRGTLMSIGAGLVCAASGVGIIGCALAQGGAWFARSHKRALEGGGWSATMDANLSDAALTGLTLGFVKVPMTKIQYRSLGGIKRTNRAETEMFQIMRNSAPKVTMPNSVPVVGGQSFGWQQGVTGGASFLPAGTRPMSCAAMGGESGWC